MRAANSTSVVFIFGRPVALPRARIQCGAWLGLAITFKLTPVLFIPLLLWKRRFAEAAAAICFIIVFNVIMPGLIWSRIQTCAIFLFAIFRFSKVLVALYDPSENGIERPSHRSQSLKLAIARYLQTYPPGHPLFIDRNYDDVGCTQRGIDPSACQRHPLFIQFLNLPKATAKRIVILVIFRYRTGGGLAAATTRWLAPRPTAICLVRWRRNGRSPVLSRPSFPR